MLNFARKYGRQVLEDACKQALEYSKVTYTFVKNCIPVVAGDLSTSDCPKRVNNARNKGNFVMSAEAMDDFFSGRKPKFIVPELRDLMQ